MVSDDERNWGHWGRVGARPAVPWCRLSWSPIMSEIGGIGAGRVSRARACALPHSLRSERYWGQLGPAGVTRFGDCGLPRSPIMSTIGAIGAGWVSLSHGLRSSGGCRALRPMVSDHERNWPGGCHALRACGRPWSPIMSQAGVTRSGLWSRAGVKRFGPAVSHGLQS